MNDEKLVVPETPVLTNGYFVHNGKEIVAHGLISQKDCITEIKANLPEGDYQIGQLFDKQYSKRIVTRIQLS